MGSDLTKEEYIRFSILGIILSKDKAAESTAEELIEKAEKLVKFVLDK